jgi:sugar diacid utilization regulator
VSILPNSITGIYNGIIITLVPTHFIRPYSDDNRDKLITFLEMNNMIATVSFIFTELMDSSTYFEQCQSMLSMIDSSTSCGSILLYGEYCFRHITSIIDDPSIIISSIHPAMKFMKKYDEENSTEYLVTLETFLQKNRSAPAAAEALHIHKSTFFYRIEKMKSLFGIDINDADKMFAYEISLKIMNVCHLR